MEGFFEKKWYLDRINILEELPEEDVTSLIKNATKKLYEKGGRIFSAGNHGNSMFLIKEGTVKIYHVAEDGKESILWFRYKGELFGLAEAIGGEKRMYFAEAVEPTTMFTIEREVFEELLLRNPKLTLILKIGRAHV